MRPPPTRRSVLAGAGAAPWISASSRAEARGPFRVGLLIGDSYPTMVAAFRGELRRLGYREGENLLLDVRQVPPDVAPRHAAELAASGLDVVVAASLPHALMFRSANAGQKMVVATAAGMVSNGLAQSLERPGGNVTGMDELPAGLTGHRLRLLKTAAPSLTRVALLSTTPGQGGHEIQLADVQAVAPKFGVAVRPYRATTVPELSAALSALAADGMEGIVNFQGGLSLGQRDSIVAFAREHRLPAIYQSKLFVEAGGLMAYAPDQDEQFREAARYVDRILKGARPGDLPIRHPARYFLSVNPTSAEAIGLNLPASLVRRADHVLG